LVNVLYIMSSY